MALELPPFLKNLFKPKDSTPRRSRKKEEPEDETGAFTPGGQQATEMARRIVGLDLTTAYRTVTGAGLRWFLSQSDETVYPRTQDFQPNTVNVRAREGRVIAAWSDAGPGPYQVGDINDLPAVEERVWQVLRKHKLTEVQGGPVVAVGTGWQMGRAAVKVYSHDPQATQRFLNGHTWTTPVVAEPIPEKAISEGLVAAPAETVRQARALLAHVRAKNPGGIDWVGYENGGWVVHRGGCVLTPLNLPRDWYGRPVTQRLGGIAATTPPAWNWAA